MRLFRQLPLMSLLVLTALSTGCHWVSDESSETGDDDQALLGEAVVNPSAAVTPARPGVDPSGLGANLKPGDRFALVKTVEQTVTQVASTSQPNAIGQSRLELTMNVTVVEVRDGRKCLALGFERVRYRHNLPGKQIQFDSAQPIGPIAPELQAYQGLVGNGFYFWLSTDNRIDQVIGFEDFLKRCVRGSRTPYDASAVAALWESSGPDAVVHFFDDTIGVFPAASAAANTTSAVNIGQEWTRQREIVQPLPMFLRNRYTLKSLDANRANIEFVGSIAPSPSALPVADGRGQIRLHMRGGHSAGSCIIDTGTGLPVQSRIERHIDMVVTLADGSQFAQQKHVVTLLQVHAPATLAGADPGQRDNAAAPAQPGPANAVIEAGHSRTVR